VRPLPFVWLAPLAALSVSGCRGAAKDAGDAGAVGSAPDSSIALTVDTGPTTFAGRYTGSVGPTTITQRENAVTMTYGAGRIDCLTAAESLVCTWREGTSTGRAKLTRVAEGHLVGTWGAGSSDNDGGEWRFIPADDMPDALVPPLPPPMDARPPHPRSTG
jgi:hypothetical protein